MGKLSQEKINELLEQDKARREQKKSGEPEHVECGCCKMHQCHDGNNDQKGEADGSTE